MIMFFFERTKKNIWNIVFEAWRRRRQETGAQPAKPAWLIPKSAKPVFLCWPVGRAAGPRQNQPKPVWDPARLVSLVYIEPICFQISFEYIFGVRNI